MGTPLLGLLGPVLELSDFKMGNGKQFAISTNCEFHLGISFFVAL